MTCSFCFLFLRFPASLRAVAIDWRLLGMAVRRDRKKLGWTQAELAEAAETSTRTITTLESGRAISRTNARMVFTALEWPMERIDVVLEDDRAGKARRRIKDLAAYLGFGDPSWADDIGPVVREVEFEPIDREPVGRRRLNPADSEDVLDLHGLDEDTKRALRLLAEQARARNPEAR